MHHDRSRVILNFSFFVQILVFKLNTIASKRTVDIVYSIVIMMTLEASLPHRSKTQPKTEQGTREGRPITSRTETIIEKGKKSMRTRTFSLI